MLSFKKKRSRFMLETLKVGRISLTRILHRAMHISMVDEDVKERTVEKPGRGAAVNYHE